MTPQEEAELRYLAILVKEAWQRRQTQCQGKQRFPNYPTASVAARQHAMGVYRCPSCGGWHVGSEVQVRKNRRVYNRLKGRFITQRGE